MTVKGAFVVLELNDDDFSEPLMEKFGIQFNAEAGQFGNDSQYIVRLTCWMREIRGQALVPVLKSAVTGSRRDGLYQPEDVDTLKTKMATPEFWAPIKAEIEEQNKRILGEEFAELLFRAEDMLRSINSRLQPDQQEVEITIKVRVKPETVETLSKMPKDILGFTLSNVDSIVSIWKRYKDLGFTDEQAGALVHWSLQEAEERRIKLLKSE
jgi:hypothetical protein